MVVWYVGGGGVWSVSHWYWLCCGVIWRAEKELELELEWDDENEDERGDRGEDGDGDGDGDLVNKPVGVPVPAGVEGDDIKFSCTTPLRTACPEASASLAARRRRFVVPSAFVDPDRAEQTMAILLRGVDGSRGDRYEGTMSRAIETLNLPTEVPPYFWTTQREEGVSCGVGLRRRDILQPGGYLILYSQLS